MTPESIFADLADESRPLIHSRLASLSALDHSELEGFRRVWGRMRVERRREVGDWLLELAEDNVEMDFSVLFRHFLRDEDEDIRAKGIRGLWECEERTLIDIFIHMLQHDPSNRVRADTASALGKFSALAEEGKLLARDADRLQKALLSVIDDRSASQEVRRRAVEGIAPFSIPRVKELILDGYNNPDLNTRCSALYAMGRNGNPGWLDTLLRELRSRESAIRYEAAAACGELGDQQAVEHLLPLLRDQDTQVQLSAIRALGVLGGPVASKALRKCLADFEEPLREVVEDALREAETHSDTLAYEY